MLGSATVLRGNALDLPLDDGSVDLCVTSPPYWSLRAYQDNGEAYDGQIGSEATSDEFVDNLLAATREMVRVSKPTGSIFVNLGDKFSDKSLMLLPQRYAIRYVDELGLILRAEIVWAKPNGLPESVTDRVRRSHEVWWHFTLQPRYFSAVDEIREDALRPPSSTALRGPTFGNKTNSDRGDAGAGNFLNNPLGKLPGSVWTVPTEPLRVPDHLGVDHFAAFPTEWPKRIIQGWSPAGVCVECGEGRRPVADRSASGQARTDHGMGARHSEGAEAMSMERKNAIACDRSEWRTGVSYLITGYACACDPANAEEVARKSASEFTKRTGIPVFWKDYYDAATGLPPTRPAVVLDPFGGTGTTAMVAKALGRHGISVDMSADYCRLAEWRVNDLDQLAKVQGIKRSDAAREADQLDMDSLFDITPQRTAETPPARTCPECGFRNNLSNRRNCEKCGAEKRRTA